jgi:hypothetical protein
MRLHSTFATPAPPVPNAVEGGVVSVGTADGVTSYPLELRLGFTPLT